MTRLLLSASVFALLAAPLMSAEPTKPADKPKVAVGEAAPTFKIKGADGKVIDLAELTAKGPVLVRLTCGCSGCDKELTYFKEVSESYKGQITSLYIFKEPDAKVAQYVKDKKFNLLYAVDSKGDSWGVFQTKAMPTNFLIDKGGKIVAIAAGCDASGLIAQKVSDKAAKLIDAKPLDVKEKVKEKQAEKK
jgi:peroxiredoxin